MKRVLTLHEYLGLMSIDDTTYSVSRALLNMGAVPFPASGKNVDLLFVLDDSGSMDTHHFKVLDSLAELLNPLLTEHANVHFGLLTTDLATKGQFQPNGKFLTASANPVDFLDFVKDEIAHLGATGSGDEAPMANLMESITGPNLLGANGSFFQSGVPLEIVIVTDANEKTPGLTAQSILAGLRTVKPTASITVHGILAESPCAEDGVTDQRILGLLKLTGGRQMDLCASDFKPFMAELAKDILTRL